MTAGAWDFGVLVAQRECRLVVVVRDVPPDGRVVAGGAVATQFSFVRLFALMAFDALRLRFAVRCSGGMATRANDARVCATQWKIRAVVIELVPAQLDDVARAAQVLRVTRPALRGPDAR